MPGQKGIPITYMCLQISAEGGRWWTGEMWECGNGWIDLWVTGEGPLQVAGGTRTVRRDWECRALPLGCGATGPAGGWPLTGREKGCTLNLLN